MFLADIPLNIDWQQILLHLLNFVILAGGLYFILYSPIKKFMASRKDHYENLDKSANDKLEEANRKNELLDARIAKLEEELAEKRSVAFDEIESMRQVEIKNAKEEAEKIIQKAIVEGQKNKEAIMAECDKQIKTMVTEATKKIVLEESSKMYDQFLAEALGSENNGK